MAALAPNQTGLKCLVTGCMRRVSRDQALNTFGFPHLWERAGVSSSILRKQRQPVKTCENAHTLKAKYEFVLYEFTTLMTQRIYIISIIRPTKRTKFPFLPWVMWAPVCLGPVSGTWLKPRNFPSPFRFLRCTHSGGFHVWREPSQVRRATSPHAAPSRIRDRDRQLTATTCATGTGD